MAEITFTPLYTSYLKINDLYALNVSTINIATPVKESIGDIPKAALVPLVSTNTAMGDQMNRNKKSAYTELITAANMDRTSWFSNIKNELNNAIKGRDETKKDAGKALKLFLGPYWDLTKKAINTQTNVFIEMLDKFNNDETLKAHAVTLGIDGLFTGLGTSNTNFNTLYESRTSELAAQSSASASSYKPAAVKAYDNFCTVVEQAVNFIGGSSLTTLFNEMDILRKKYALLIDKDNDDDDNPTTDKPTDTTK